MTVRLPPLHTLRAFDAAARHLSFTSAANELHITQSAVSQQIRGLEHHLGLRLFHRHVRELSLTDEGQVFACAVRQAIETVSTAAMRLQDTAPAGQLTVSCLPSFATQWLVPRLGRFRRMYPKLTVKILSSGRRVDFRSQNIDLAIRWGSGRWDGVLSELLLPESIFPVCSPRLQRELNLTEPRQLLNAPLLFDADPAHDEWQRWFAAAKLTDDLPVPWLSFENTVDMIRAAAAGEGVTLVRSALVQDEIAGGRLVRLFEHEIESRFNYYAVFPPSRRSLPKVEAFRDWLKYEASM